MRVVFTMVVFWVMSLTLHGGEKIDPLKALEGSWKYFSKDVGSDGHTRAYYRVIRFKRKQSGAFETCWIGGMKQVHNGNIINSGHAGGFRLDHYTDKGHASLELGGRKQYSDIMLNRKIDTFVELIRFKPSPLKYQKKGQETICCIVRYWLGNRRLS